jgi:hypothetical protein
MEGCRSVGNATPTNIYDDDKINEKSGLCGYEHFTKQFCGQQKSKREVYLLHIHIYQSTYIGR